MNKIALITGASRGIGKAIAIELASSGYHVLLNYLKNTSAAESVLSEIKTNGGNAELIQFDCADIDQTSEAIGRWKENNEGKVIEVLVNNAGIRDDSLLVWMKQEQWNKIIDTNLNSFFNITQPLLEAMILNKFGRIVNIVSLSGQKGMSGQVNYSAAKGGIIAATKALALEVGKKNITVNAVAPGFIRTDMTGDLDEKSLKKLIPMNRFGKAEEVASLVSFLASEKAGYITGEVISINGGLYT